MDIDNTRNDNIIASVPSDIMNKALKAGNGFKFHNKEASKNWEYAR
jgi:hypothetical protein